MYSELWSGGSCSEAKPHDGVLGCNRCDGIWNIIQSHAKPGSARGDRELVMQVVVLSRVALWDGGDRAGNDAG